MINLILSLFLSVSFAELKHPKTVKELKTVTAQISNQSRTSGGSGSVVQSDQSGSLILTNNHVCEAIQPNWIVTVNGSESKIQKIKKFNDHDLCLIKVNKDYGVSLELSKRIPKATEVSIVSGHPLMLPQVVTTGHFSDEMEIEIVVDMRPCTPEEEKQYGFECMFGMPITKKYKSQLTSNLIQPGNSGSAVFNEKGQVAGVVFAGVGEIGFNFIVPALYVSYFVQNHTGYNWEKVKSNKEKKKDRQTEESSTKEFYCQNNTKLICKLNDMLKR